MRKLTPTQLAVLAALANNPMTARQLRALTGRRGLAVALLDGEDANAEALQQDDKTPLIFSLGGNPEHFALTSDGAREIRYRQRGGAK